MGIFDFLGDIGSSVLGSSPAKDVREHIEKELPGLISDLNVGFNQGTVTLSGDCDCQATKEKAILLAGNIKGVTAVDGDRLVAPAEPCCSSQQDPRDRAACRFCPSGDDVLHHKKRGQSVEDRQVNVWRCGKISLHLRSQPRSYQGPGPDLSGPDNPHPEARLKGRTTRRARPANGSWHP
jgi:hypothetical protein